MSRIGQNRGYIDELYASYTADPNSVSPAWRDYFADYSPSTPLAVPAAPKPKVAASEQTEQAEPLVGIAGKIAENMVSSLAVPTATSARTMPVKILEENRRVVNMHQRTIAGPKVSFTHLIAWGILRALERHPEMSVRYADIDDTPHRVPLPRVNLGLAVDLERKGERVLLVPNIKDAGSLDFPGFLAALNGMIDGARRNTLGVDDYQGTTLTLTNPGMIGTALSVPRLMQGQGVIFGTGTIGFPPEYSGAAPEMLTELGISKIMTVTSTYDHRVIQGAASGAFLATLERLLSGEEGFYDRVFSELGVPHEPARWAADRNPPLLGAGARGEAIAKQAGVVQLIRAFRVRGHLLADLDPLGYKPEQHPELELSHYGLSVWDMDRRFVIEAGATGSQSSTLREILETLQSTYCRHVGVQYLHIQDPEPRRWLQQRLEHPGGVEPLLRDSQIRVLKKLNAAEAFESFIGTNYVGQKRFSLEGAETLIPMLDQLLHDAAEAEVEEVVIGMAHRGRLNVLANVVGKSHGQIFREFEGYIDPKAAHGSGDVKYHLGASGEFVSPDGRRVRVQVASNPSHLEAVNPVVEGICRALQDRSGDTERSRVVPLLIHGDAAFAGQGVVAETLHLSQLKGYRTGGTVHVVVNNQIGFTTGPADQRSSHYATDVAGIVGAPIFHVNGDHPESAVRVMQLAFAFRQAFRRDVVVDLVCYRRWGHNEGDDPSYTHPQLYAKIENHRSVRKLYTDQLLRRGDFDVETAEKALEDFRKALRTVHDEVRAAEQDDVAGEPLLDVEATAGKADIHAAETIDSELLRRVMRGLVRTPDEFRVHPKLVRQLEQRSARYDENTIDWALGEALAFGSLVLSGVPVRLSGEDSGRGTFSQRHAALYDHRTAEPFVPLSHLDPEQAPFTVFDSLLSEFAVLGFEYGYSVSYPQALVLWEAQFGDFVNGAQVIIDQFLTCAEEKWGQTCGLVLLLPHGYEGQGPEHSSARLERFLQLAARGNIRVANPTTPAQYFHLLREQAVRAKRTPLIVMTPKSLLRHRACISAADEFTDGGFKLTLDDPRELKRDAVSRIVLCSGKVYYDLIAHAADHAPGVAVCRVEQLYPYAYDSLAALLDRYPAARDVVWVQEESRNMGAWSFVAERLAEQLRDDQRLRYVGRPRSASVATGSLKRHLAEQQALVEEAFADQPSPGSPPRAARSFSASDVPNAS